MAKKKTAAKKKKAPDTSPRSVEEMAHDLRYKSSSSRFASYERVAGKGLDGDLIIEHRGEPKPNVESPGA